MDFKIGQRIRPLDDVGEGTIIEIHEETLNVLMDTGFHEDHMKSSVVGIRVPDIKKGLQQPEIKNKVSQDFNLGSQQKKQPQKKSKTVSGDAEHQKEWSLDLHIDMLVEQYEHLSNAEMLAIQMTRCRSYVDKNMERGIKRFVIIHGKGAGVLKAAVHHYLINRDDVVFDDADNLKYGNGATLVQFTEY